MAQSTKGPGPKSSALDGNPVFFGLPRLRFKLPSRNWLIFLTITGSFTTAIVYDRTLKRRTQRKWCDAVAHLALEPLPARQMPRKITVFLAAHPGDGLRPSREFFVDYVKPILIAGGIDWDVVEGRREGEVRAGLAERIRKLRIARGEEAPEPPPGEEVPPPDTQTLLAEIRVANGIQEWQGLGGDLVLGRHTWKEYVRGLHEGWLGPLKPPEPPAEHAPPFDPIEAEALPSSSESLLPEEKSDEQSATASPPPLEEEEKPKPKTPTAKPPYILPPDYPSSAAAPSLPNALPSQPLPHPHILGFSNTLIRFRRYMTQRRIADRIGHDVAALVLASQTRAYRTLDASEVPPPPPNTTDDVDDASPSTSKSNSTYDASPAPSDSSPPPDPLSPPQPTEQSFLLLNEEAEWHKSARAPNKDDEKDKERPWTEGMVIDERIGQRMRTFVLAEGDEARAREFGDKGDGQSFWQRRVEWARGWAEWSGVVRPKEWMERGRGWRDGEVEGAE